MNLFCVGISHHTANVATRERYACEPDGRYAADNNRLRRAVAADDMQPGGSLCRCHQSDFHPGHCGRSFAPVADCDIADTSAFYRIRGGGVRKASVSRSFRSGFDGGGRDGDSRPGKKGVRAGSQRRARRAAPSPAVPACVPVSRSKFAPTPKSRVAPCRSDRSQSISQKRFLEHWTIERFLFSAPEKRASARRARS